MVFSAAVLFAYNTFQDNLGTVQAPDPVVPSWSILPVTWYLNAATPSKNVIMTGCSVGDLSGCIQQSLANAFATWVGAKVAGQSLTDLNVSYGGASSLTTPDSSDCQNVIGFSDSASDFSTGTIAFTQVATVTLPAGGSVPFQYACSGGANQTCYLTDCIADADIEFNPNETFYTNTAPSSGTAFSLQSVATHEEGHLLGMDHSGIGHAVMFPFGDTSLAGQQLSLTTDDDIGISYLYPCTSPSGSSNCTADFSSSTGVISGTVTLNGAGAFAAHVVVINANTGNVVTDRLTSPDGTYKLVGVPPGSYHVLVLPLAPNDSSGIVSLGDFSGWECGYADSSCTTVPENPTNYTGRYY